MVLKIVTSSAGIVTLKEGFVAGECCGVVFFSISIRLSKEFSSLVVLVLL
jgi:hypothetical protein